jgi:hypothetical protein
LAGEAKIKAQGDAIAEYIALINQTKDDKMRIEKQKIILDQETHTLRF